MKTLNSTFAILDVRRKDNLPLAKRLRGAPVDIRIPVVIRGNIVSTWGKDDGISQEFGVDVTHAVETTEYIEAGGENYDREKSLALRDNLIQLRDAALKNSHMEWSVVLSHLIAWMATTIDERWPE